MPKFIIVAGGTIPTLSDGVGDWLECITLMAPEEKKIKK